ncbi:type IV secretion system DNA-binding domain-containing protein [Neolewinella lacunae]|uniref:Type IV secretion system DNA-binding domain-containing protein n=1 Tax=Neolewinella lacunae TaxID=1517758 RepID=A0A923PKX2_9BACT|nr:ATP-binding protein [Neolewinella lacunae]MBC6993571.1 type IV secretion system DNA-binding domain-containing protein [Neolewinella lacunae]MDN3636154.1 type IV secretion system DNA-binding domain-containing protein [Neolewinella lacunae]
MKERQFARPYADVSTPFTVDERGAFAEFIIQDPELMPDLALGGTVLVVDKNNAGPYYLAGQVVGLRSLTPFSPERENLLYIEPDKEDPSLLLEEITGPHTHQPMIIRIRLEREMRVDAFADSGYVISAVQRPPSARSRMFFPDLLPGVTDAPSLQQILEIKPSGLGLGNVGFGNKPYESNGNFLTYRWDVENLDNKHMFIVGESGSGKTVFLKNLAYELRRQDTENRIILTDVQGDIIQLLLPNIAEPLKARDWQKNVEYDSPKSIYETLGKFQLIIPAKLKGSSPNVIALKELASRNGVQVREVGLRLQDLTSPSDVEYLFRSSSDQVAMLLDDEAEFIRNNNGVPTLAKLKGALNHALGLSRENQIASHAGTSYYRSTFQAGLRALHSLREYFDFHQKSLNDSSNPMDFFDFDGTTILYLDELDHDERVMWEMQLVKWLYDNKKESWKAFVFFDEAHQIIPAKPSGSGSIGTFERLRVNFERLAREGRKFGINLVLSTQNPKDLHPIVPEQCPTKIVMKINPKNASVVNMGDDLAMIANRFGHGQFWISSPFNGTPDWVRVHSWAPPLPHEPMTKFWDKVIDAAKKR